MRAALIPSAGGVPVVSDHARPQRSHGQTIVEIAVAALNPLDLLVASGRHPIGPPKVPYVPGIEGVGVVVESDLHPVGARVRVSVSAGLVDGTLAELVVAPDPACLPIPDGIEDDDAAALGTIGISALIALRDQARMSSGESVLVLGATGAFGQALIQIAKALGASRVVAGGRNVERLQRLLSAGADAVVVIEPTSPDVGEALKSAGGPFDVIADPLWGPFAAVALRHLAVAGRYVNVGQMAGPHATIDGGTLRHGRRTITGFSGATCTPAESAEAFGRVMDLAARRLVRIEHRRYSLDRVADAWRAQLDSPGHKVLVVP